MGRTVLLCLIALLWPNRAYGGPIYGSIFHDGRALTRASITIACAGGSTPGSTLDDGSYRVNVPQTGRCTFTVAVPGGAARTEVVSSSGAVMYNFAVVKGNAGYELRRQ